MFYTNGRSKLFVSRVLGTCNDNCELLELKKSILKRNGLRGCTGGQLDRVEHGGEAA
jgi:hypothetical protein